MKRIILSFLVLSLFSCGMLEGSGNDEHPEKAYEIKIIDNCEYIYVSRRPYAADFAITHKGNCKNHQTK